MKRKVLQRLFCATLSAAMIVGNISTPYAIDSVYAATDTAGLTKVTDEDIAQLYNPVTYSAKSVHDPSVIKDKDGNYYVFGSHTDTAKTSDLMNWTTVNSGALFEGVTNVKSDEQLLAAFDENAFHGQIAVKDTAAAAEDNAAAVEVIETVLEEVVEETEETTEEAVETEVQEEVEETEAPVEESEDTAETVEAETVIEVETVAEVQAVENEATEETVVETEEAAEETVVETEEAAEETVVETEEAAEETVVETEEAAEETVVETEEAAEETVVETEEAVVETVMEVVEEMVAVDTAAGETVMVDFGTFDAGAWSTASAGLAINGNLWAPDVVWNPTMNKYCMYLSLNGNHQNSVIILLTSDAIEGPYVYQAPVVYTGFTAVEDAPNHWSKTDIEYALGEMETLPERYQNISAVTTNDAGKITGVTSTWGDQWPHAIDAAVFYDDAGKLWMIYGSWSGGIYTLELDENTGLRDYTVTYESDYDTQNPKSVKSDPYFGKKIAGGYYVSGEGPYIEKIGNYYYLFMSYGFYAPNGGYNMRIFRSENPDGPFLDTKGTSAIFDSFSVNFTANYDGGTPVQDTRGMRLMNYYQWDHMLKGEVAQGHNSAIVDDDGRAYVIYHTKLNDNTAVHELRVHELFQNKNGWILASPFAFANDDAISYTETPGDITGEYEIILTDHTMGWDANSGDLGSNYNGDVSPLADIVTVKLEAGGTITKDGENYGTWSLDEGTPYVTITVDGQTFTGVAASQTKDIAGIRTMTFTAVDEATGETIWGARTLGDMAIIANNVMNPAYTVPETVYGTFSLPTKGSNDVAISWESKNPEIVTDSGKVLNYAAEDQVVGFTMTMVKGDYYYTKDYEITILGTSKYNEEEPLLLGEALTGESLALDSLNNGSEKIDNPYNVKTTAGLNISGASIEFDTKHTGSVNPLAALLAFGGPTGKLYFTQGSYLGYNADGGWYDANLYDYKLVKDYIGEAITASGNETAHVKIDLTLDGFDVYVDGVLAFDETILADSATGDGTLTDYSRVLSWLQNTADTVYFGYGSWWADSAKATISNVKFYAQVASSQEAVDTAATALAAMIPSETVENITLPTEGEMGTDISWTSSNTEVISVSGNVIIPETTTDVVLRATVSKGAKSKEVSFTVKVLSDVDSIARAIEALTAAIPAETAESITLPTEGVLGTTISWATSNAAVIAADGTVTTPSKTTVVTLTATITKNGKTETKTFDVKVKKPATANSYLEMDEVKLESVTQLTSMDNPFYGKNLESLMVSYKITIPEGAYKSGYDGLFSFYTTEGAGRVSFQSNPYICYNKMAPAEETNYYADINSPAEGANNLLAGWNYGEEYAVTIDLNTDACKVYVDGELVVENASIGGNATLEDTLNAIAGYEKLSWGTGSNQTGFWGTQVCTLRDVKMSSKPYIAGGEIEETSEMKKIANPLYGQDLKEVVLDFTVKFAEDAFMAGWDGLVAFDDNATYPDGKFSVQSAPYICYNDWSGNWADINSPANGTAAIASYEKGAEAHYYIRITPDELVMKLDGEEIDYTWAGEGNVTFQSMLDYIAGSESFCWGTDSTNCLWAMEKCTIKNGSITGYKNDVDIAVVDDIRVVAIPDQQYTGSAIKPQVVVYDGKNRLTEKVDYTVKYANNKNVSTDTKKASVTITPKGNYDKTKKTTVYFNILPREITEENVTVTYKPVLNVKYKKGAVVGQTQSVKVKFGKVTVPAKQYTVTYMKDGAAVEKLTEAGTYQMVIQTKEGSSFNGTLTYDITLTDKILMSALKIKTKNQSYDTVSANTLFDEWKVTYKNKNVLAEGQKLTDLFDISAVEDLLPGTKTVTFTAKADSPYYGSKDATFKITGVSIAKAKLTGFQSKMAYTGEAVTQDVTLVMNKGKKTEYTIDPAKYTVSYANNTNAGKAKMIITGKDEFTGTKITKTFTIGKSALKADSVSVNFIGQEAGSSMTVSQNILGATPDIEVKKGDQTLEKGTDYTVSYSSNKAVGTGKVTVKFKGNYSGTLKNVLTFQIVAKDVTDSSIEMVVTDLKYSSKDKYKAKVAVYDNGKKLATSQYTIGAVTDLVYEKDETGADTKCGTAKAVISGKKNYTGTKEVTVVIKEALLSSVKAKVDGTFFYENGKEIRPTELTVTIGSGKKKQTLTRGVDYIIVEDSYKNNVKAGRATLTIQGIGKYGGTKEVKFTILPRWLKLN